MRKDLGTIPDPVKDPSFRIVGVISDAKNQGIQEPTRPEMFIPASHFVAKVQFFGRDYRREDVSLTFGLTFLGPLFNQVLLPLLAVFIFRISKGNAGDVLLRFRNEP